MRRFLFVLLLAILAACSNSDVSPGPDAAVPDSEEALITDADLDAARLFDETEYKSVDAAALEQALPNRAGGFEPSVSAQQASEVPLDDRSTLAFVEQRGRNYRIVLRETRPEGRGGGYRTTLVYRSEREVTSVSVNADANLLFFTAESKDGNVEGYAYDRDGSSLGEEGLVQLTDTAADEADASMSLDGGTFAWESEGALAVATLEPRLSVTVYAFEVGGEAVSVADPSLSGSGETAVFVADGDALDAESDVVASFELAEGTLSGLYEGNARSPSLSFSADLLLFAEGDAVRYVDLAEGELTTLLDDAEVQHPFLTSDGLYFIYALEGDVYTRLVDTDSPDDAPQDLIEDDAAQPYWAKSDFELRYSSTNIGEPRFTRPDDGSGLSDEQRTVRYHKYSFVAPVTDRYTIRSEQDYDGYLLLYEGFFNPRRPEVNLVAFNDDFAGGYSPNNDPPGVSRIREELESGQRYIVVTTACGTESCGPATGRFTNTITRNAPPPPPPFVLPDPQNEGYNITLRFTTDNLTDEQKAVFEGAADRWAAIITEDLANIEDFALPPDFTFGDTGPVEGTLDDLLIDVAFNNLDGPSGLLGRAGPRLIREDEDAPLTVYGLMEFDISEFGDGGFFDDEQQYEDVIVHEMGHVIGIGTLWDLTGNTEGVIDPGDPGYPDGPPTVDPGLPNPDYDPRFTGPLAVEEYQTLLEAAGRDLEESVPIANTGGPGNYNGHWRELVFDNELMTPYAGGLELLSRMTAGSLGDLGYTVDVDSDAVDENYALPLDASFAQVAPNDVTYEPNEDFIKFSGSQGSAEASVQAVDLALGSGNESTSGCEAADFADFTAGNIALLQRGTCPFIDKVANAQAAGALGVVMFNQGNTEDRTGLFRGQAGDATIPAVGITYDLGVTLAELADAGSLVVSIDTPVATMELQTLGVASTKPAFDEVLLGPIGTVSPDGDIKLFGE